MYNSCDEGAGMERFHNSTTKVCKVGRCPVLLAEGTLQIADSRQQAAEDRQQTADDRQQAADSRQQTIDS
jgi:hypothetical protein